MPGNDTLLLVAFVSFFLFAALQTVFAVIGHSESMLGETRGGPCGRAGVLDGGLGGRWGMGSDARRVDERRGGPEGCEIFT